MPLLQIEDISPFLTYSQDDWWLGQDSLTRSSGGSITATNTSGATVSFSFYGTGVEIFGSKRPEFGTYRVTLDNESHAPEDGRASPSIWHQSLFKTTNLPKGDHVVTFENIEAKRRDFDYITWELSVGEDGEPVTVHTIQDSHFIYEPEGRWTTDAPSAQSYSGGTGHATNFPGAIARLRFKGDAIALYGPVGPQAALIFTVQVDDRNPQSFSASTFDFERLRTKQLMYFGSNLGPGEHEIVIRLGQVSSAQQVLAIDYAEIFTTPSIGGGLPLIAPANTSSSNTPQNSTDSSSSSKSSAPTGLIAAVAVLGALALVCLALLIWIFILVKKGKLRRHNDAQPTPSVRPDPTLLSSVLHSNGHSPNPGVIPVPFHIESSRPLSAASPKHQSTFPQATWNDQSPTSFSRSAGLPSGHSNSDSLTSRLSSLGPIGFSTSPSMNQGGKGALRQETTTPAPPPVYSDS